MSDAFRSDHDPAAAVLVETQRRRRAGRANPFGTLAALGLLLALAALAVGAYWFGEAAVEQPPSRAVEPRSTPRLHYAVDLPPFPQRR